MIAKHVSIINALVVCSRPSSRVPLSQYGSDMLDKLITKAISAFVAWLRANAWHTYCYVDDSVDPEGASYAGKCYLVGDYAIVIMEHKNGNGSSILASKQ